MFEHIGLNLALPYFCQVTLDKEFVRVTLVSVMKRTRLITHVDQPSVEPVAGSSHFHKEGYGGVPPEQSLRVKKRMKAGHGGELRR